PTPVTLAARMVNWYAPSLREPAGSMPTGPPATNVIVTVLPACTALRLTRPVGAPGPVRASWKASAGLAGKVTASEKVTTMFVTIDRWVAPLLTFTEVTVVGAAAGAPCSRAPMSVAPAGPLTWAGSSNVRTNPRWSPPRPAELLPASM